ncbi:MAG: hypothetical protein AAGM67_20360 [Bacteroidota bacterium]
METFSIAAFPYYRFENRQFAYTIGSAFYGIYFLVSFPVFYRLEEPGIQRSRDMLSVILEAFGVSMIVLLLLDFVRNYVEEPLHIPGSLWA